MSASAACSRERRWGFLAAEAYSTFQVPIRIALSIFTVVARLSNPKLAAAAEGSHGKYEAAGTNPF